MNATITWTDAKERQPQLDSTVLMHCPRSADPVWLGYWDGYVWHDVDGADLGPKAVRHWAELPSAPGKAARVSARPARTPGPSAIEALETVERLLRGGQTYFSAVDRAGKVSLGQWLKRVILRCKKEAR